MQPPSGPPSTPVYGIPPQNTQPPQQPYPPPQQQQPYAPQPGTPQRRGKTSGLAIAALVLSCIVFLPIIPLVGAVLGIVAVIRLPAAAPGKGLAIAAIPIGAVVTMIHLLLAAIAIPAFVGYMRRAKALEARMQLAKLRVGARQYLALQHYSNSGQPQARRLPAGSRLWTPSQSCCSQGGKCLPNANEWKAAHWRALRFAMTDPHYFQYRFYSSGSERDTRVVMEARADLDCDGVYSSYKVVGTIGADGELRFSTTRRRRPYE